jgi:hypothetical protein
LASNEQYKRCYLYTSSLTGDYYIIGYYSEVSKRFIAQKKVRTGKVERYFV